MRISEATRRAVREAAQEVVAASEIARLHSQEVQADSRRVLAEAEATRETVGKAKLQRERFASHADREPGSSEQVPAARREPGAPGMRPSPSGV